LRRGIEAAIRSRDLNELCILKSYEVANTYFIGDFLVSIERAEAERPFLRQHGEGETRVLYYLSSSYFRLGDMMRAEHHALEGLALHQDREGAPGKAIFWIRLGEIAWWRLIQ